MTDQIMKVERAFYNVFFDERGKLKRLGWNSGGYQIDYCNNVKNIFGIYNKVLGYSVFIPTIICKKDRDGKQRFFMTLDDQCALDSVFTSGSHYFSYANKIKEIEITGWSTSEIIGEFRRIMNMSNEQIMTEFCIEDMGNAFLAIALLVDDIVQKKFDSQNDYYERNIRDTYKNDYIHRFFKSTIVAHSKENQIASGFILITEDKKLDEQEVISYDILTPLEKSRMKDIKIKITEKKVHSELGKEILHMLQDRFVEKQIENGKETDEAEQMLNEQKNVDANSHATLLAVCMKEKSTDLENAGQHIVKGQGRNEKTSKSARSEQ